MAGAECVIGVDFGTLSGRAVVVSVEDGAELGSAVHDYAHAVIERELPASGERLPPQWALQDPEDYIDVLREAVPAAVAAAGIEPDQVIGIATDFTASTPAARPRRRDPAVPVGRPARAPARLPQALEAPRGGRAGRADQRRGARARRALARRATAG